MMDFYAIIVQLILDLSPSLSSQEFLRVSEPEESAGNPVACTSL